MIEEKNANIQCIVASVTDYKYFDIEEIMSDKENSIIVILDKITDPHNLGAVARTVECLGVDGIIIPERGACSVNDTVVKVSAGAIENVKIVKVININNAIEKLKKNGYWIYGLDMQGENTIQQEKLKGKIVIVIGNEGNGISDLTKKNCDVILNIPMKRKDKFIKCFSILCYCTLGNC